MHAEGIAVSGELVVTCVDHFFKARCSAYKLYVYYARAMDRVVFCI